MRIVIEKNVKRKGVIVQDELTHFDLCKLTAERFVKDSDIVLYEFACMGADEHPDVLCFRRGYTTLYEIKTSVSDFKADNKKECRIKYREKYVPGYKNIRGIRKPCWIKYGIKKRNYEKPHLGSKRYYVCPAGMIDKNNVGEWGLYWVKRKRFYLQKQSEIFNRNIFLEMELLTLAMRKMAAGFNKNILIKEYSKK